MATTTPSATLPGAASLSEWFSRVSGFIEGCGEASALVAAHIVSGQPLSTSELTSTIQNAVARGQTVDRGGAQTAPQVQSDLAQLGVASTVQYGASNLSARLDAALRAGEPVVVGVSQGGRLAGERAGLHGHYITVVGGSGATGYAVADPNTQAATSGGLIQDSLQQLLAAAPFATVTPTHGATRGSGGAGATGAGSTSSTQTLSSGGGNPLSPADWVTAIKTGFTDATQRVGLTFFGGLLMLVGVMVLFFAVSREEAGQAAQAAGPAIEAGAEGAAA